MHRNFLTGMQSNFLLLLALFIFLLLLSFLQAGCSVFEDLYKRPEDGGREYYRDKDADSDIKDDRLEYLEVRSFDFDLYLFLFNPDLIKNEDNATNYKEVNQNKEYYEAELKEKDSPEWPEENSPILHLIIRHPFYGEIIQNDYILLDSENLKELAAVVRTSGLIEQNGTVDNTRGIPDSAGYLDVDARYSNGQSLYYRENGHRNHLLINPDTQKFLAKLLLAENKSCLPVLGLFGAPKLEALYLKELSYKINYEDGSTAVDLTLKQKDTKFYISGSFTKQDGAEINVAERMLEEEKVEEFFEHFADYTLLLDLADWTHVGGGSAFNLTLPNDEEVAILAFFDEAGDRQYLYELEEALIELAEKE